MGDLACRVPCAAGRQFGLFQQHSVVAPAFVAQMIGKAHAHDAAADDDHACSRWKLIRHSCPLSASRFSLDRLSEQKYHRQS